MKDKDHRAKTATGTAPNAQVLATELTPDEAAGVEAIFVDQRGLSNLSNDIPPLNMTLPKNASRIEAGRRVLEKAKKGEE